MTVVPESIDLATGTRIAHPLSLLLLVVFNLFPAVGVIVFGWDVGSLMVLYWSENLIIGAYTVVKMLIVSPLGGVFAAAFFLLHFGGFCSMHGLFIGTLVLDLPAALPGSDSWPIIFIFLQLLYEVVIQILSVAPDEWMFAFAALCVSHGVSTVQYFILGDEKSRVDLGQLMRAPYSRVMVLHVSIIMGGFAALALEQSMPMLLFLIVLKTAVDIVLHTREHKRFSGQQGAGLPGQPG
ncbi:MAG: DUF6498-containing protein [Halieaceae bacterium]|jgi:hypothetical protein|nr:DUF6498-containing protein [Halieaceae bacterium]